MHTLSAFDMVRVWELGEGKPSWYQALLMLAPAWPETSQQDLASLSLGHRNALLFLIRKRLFGPKLQAGVKCPACSEVLEFELLVDQLCDTQSARSSEETYDLVLDSIDIRFRLPNTWDIAALCGSLGGIFPLEVLAQRCIETVRVVETSDPNDDDEIDLKNSLDEATLQQVMEQIQEHDPQFETRLGLDCDVCKHSWSAPFDMGTFLWTEWSAHAKRLTEETHVLAKNYGWSEREILMMSPVRRNQYLELALG
jgi:T4 bacteriophage base plate protein